MAESAGGKVCVLCGQDCAGRPRVKDPAGHYYCRPCYDEQSRKQPQRAAAAPVATAPSARPIAAAAPAPAAEDDPFAIHMDFIASTGNGHDAGHAPGLQCPQCGIALGVGAALCVNCGYDLRAGRPIEIVTQKAPVAARGPRAGRSVWPIIIGIVSIFFGGCGTIGYGIQLGIALLAAAASGSLKSTLTTLGAGSLATFLSLWLLTAGIGIVRRSRRGPWSIRRWAVAKAVVCVICFSLAALMFSNIDTSRAAPQQLREIGSESLILAAAIMLGWFLAWPIFTLIWFSRAAVRADVREWR